MAEAASLALADELARQNREISRLTTLLVQYEADMHLIDQVSQTLGVGFAGLEELYQTIYEQICATLTVDVFSIILAQPGATSGRYTLWIDGGQRYPPQDAEMGPLARWIIEHAEPLLFEDVYREAPQRFGAQPRRYGQRGKQARSWLGVPMMVRGQVKGVMSVQSYQPALYGDRERRLLRVIASQSAVAIENAQLFQQAQQALEQLSMPIVPVHDEVLVLPLIGAVDARRAARIVEALLEGIERHGARVVIIDITGVPTVDTEVADALLRAARAARLLGTQAVLTGIHPRVAEILVALGVDLSELATRSNLQAGIGYALDVVRKAI